MNKACVCKPCACVGVDYLTGRCLVCGLPRVLARGASYFSLTLGKWISSVADVAEERRVAKERKDAQSR